MATRKKIKKEMSSNNNGHRPELFKSISQRKILYGPMTPEDEAAEFTKTSRTDYGRPIDLRIPRGYHAQVQKSWQIYEADRLFRYLIDRCIDFGVNGFEWELPFIDKPSVWTKISTLMGAEKSGFKKIMKEKKVWDTWASQINRDAANVIPGIDEINKWIMKNLLLCGMAPMEWEWEKVTIDKVEYTLPVRFTMYNALSTLLRRENTGFINEQAFVKISNTTKIITEGNKTVNQINTLFTAMVNDSSNFHEIPLLGRPNKKKGTQGFVLKYNWSPGDNTCLVQGATTQVGQGLYPTPPFVGLYEQMILRRQLNAADVCIADGIINYIIDWEVGNDAKDADGNLVNQPQPAKYDSAGQKIEKSTSEQIQEMITQDTRANVMQLIHPYYYKLKIITPPIDSLINPGKYTQTIVETLMAFGIFLSPTDRRVDFTNINVANFEQMLDNIRSFHIRRFWESLCVEIVKRNEGKLNVLPNMMFNTLNTQTDNFRASLLNLAKIGKVSAESLLQAHKIDKNTELLRIAKEIGTGEKELMDSNVPVSFKQTVSEDGKPNSDGKEEGAEHSRSANAEGGRPKKTGKVKT